MDKKEIYEKALGIIIEQDEQIKYMEACQKAGLCSKCGGQTQKTERYAGYFGFITDYSCKKCGER